MQRIKPTKFTWSENQIYEYLLEDTTNTVNSIVPHFGELMYATKEDEAINKIGIIPAHFTGKIKDRDRYTTYHKLQNKLLQHINTNQSHENTIPTQLKK